MPSAWSSSTWLITYSPVKFLPVYVCCLTFSTSPTPLTSSPASLPPVSPCRRLTIGSTACRGGPFRGLRRNVRLSCLSLWTVTPLTASHLFLHLLPPQHLQLLHHHLLGHLRHHHLGHLHL